MSQIWFAINNFDMHQLIVIICGVRVNLMFGFLHTGCFLVSYEKQRTYGRYKTALSTSEVQKVSLIRNSADQFNRSLARVNVWMPMYKPIIHDINWNLSPSQTAIIGSRHCTCYNNTPSPSQKLDESQHDV